MAFRLQSFVAGAAKKMSENISKLDDEYRESIKNTAANLAKEAAAVRKERMASVTNYNRKARRLKTSYDLTDGQIQTLLSGGLEEADRFEEAIKSGQAMSKDPALFDAKTFAQGMFTMPQDGVTDGILSIADQAQAYATQTTPSTIDIQTLASGIAAGTQTPLTGISTSDVTQRLQDVAGTSMPTDSPAGGDTGISISGLGGMSASDIIAFKQQQAELSKTETQTKDIQAQTKVRGIQGNLLQAQTTAAEITNKVLPEQLRVEIDKGYASTALTEAQTEKVEQDTTKSILEVTKLSAELDTYQKFGAKNEQAALDLLEAKIVNARSPATLEAYQATLVSQANEVRDQAVSLPPEDQTRDSLIARANALDTRAAGVANMIVAQDATATTDWSKGSPEKRFASLLKNNVQAANISGALNSAGDWEWNFSNKRPAYYTAYANTVDQYSQLYGTSGNTGLVSSLQNKQQLNNVLNQWSQEGKFVGENDTRPAKTSAGKVTNINYGLKSMKDLVELQTSGDLQPGDIATTEAQIYDRESDSVVTKQVVAMYGTQGEWVSAGDF